jgi:hypothetical protein
MNPHKRSIRTLALTKEQLRIAFLTINLWLNPPHFAGIIAQRQNATRSH